ncbi:hypothetical protein B0T18DRAFT_420679 [Schizothecium vesticola]|uniref:Mid2 domain-containing protein n=1 Tax=Schizothecium vesticola TaxID=314040 RepID=A0AA40BP31_9PEZI|nr:hypothetical protein B0T18DRAFT_420679 [Schizothecium vesticola]
MTEILTTLPASLELLPHQTHAILDDPSRVNMIFSKVTVHIFVLAGNSLAQSVTLPGWSQTTIGSAVISVPSGFPDLTGTIVSILGVRNLRRACDLRRILRCQLQGHTGVHVRCVQHPRVYQLPEREMSGKLSTVNVTLPPDAPKEGGLSMSDKIALGIGLGFGIPTIIIGVGTMVCMWRRKARAAGELGNLAKDDTSPQLSPGGEPEVEAGWPLKTDAL